MAHETALSIEALGLRYGRLQALDQVSLSLQPGQLLALLGPNGAGKTSLLASVLGLRKPDAGRVTVFGQAPGSLAARRQTGVMLQDSGVPELLSVAELLELFASYHRDPQSPGEVTQALELGGLAARRFGTLSGGQKQQVLYALAVIGRPRLLLLDEPSNGLDVEARARLWRSVQALREAGTAVLLTTHYLEEADRLADRVLLLHRGRVLANDTPTAIKARLGGSELRFSSRLSAQAIAALDTVEALECSAGRVRLRCATPERLLARLLAADPDLGGLEVRPVSLEDALSTLTLENAA